MSNSIRVLHVSSGNLYGGVERFLTGLAEQRHCAPTMVSDFALCFRGRAFDELTAAGATTHELCPVRLSRPWTVWNARRKLKAILDKTHYDVVVTHMAWNHVVFSKAIRARKKPHVSWVHDVPSGTSYVERKARVMPPELAIVNSDFTLRSIDKLFDQVRSAVVYCLVPVDPFDAVRERRDAFREGMSVSPQTVVITIASRLERWKGHELLIQALARLDRGLPWKVWIAGGAQSPEQETYLQQLHDQVTAAGLNDRVAFLGPRSDVPELLCATDIHCQPNTGPEPFGVTFVEGLHAGCAVVTTRLGGAMEILQTNSGVLVEPDRPDELAAALSQLIRDDARRRSLGVAGRARALAICGEAAVLPSLERELRRVV